MYLSILSLLFFSLISHTWAKEGTLMRIQGVVQIDGQVATLGQKAPEGSIVEAVGEKSFALLSFGEDGKIILRNGKMKIGKTDSPQNTLIGLFKGVLLNYVNPIKKEGKFQINTKKAAFAVRGTKFYLEEKEDNSYLCVCEGEVMVKRDSDLVGVKRNEDLFVSHYGELKKSLPSDQMWQMAVDGLSLMEIDVEPR